ncbi:MAG: type II/IV secretion system protein [Parcubacteria group bacterium]|nr:type II/IV secretion system protein [Parcubacteria group bacterium]
MPTSFLQFLAASKLLTSEEAQALELKLESGTESVDELLISEKKLSDADLVRHKGDFYHLPPIDLTESAIKREVLNLFPKEMIVNYQIVPFASEGERLSVAMVNPENLKAREAVDFLARQKGSNTQFYVTTSQGWKHALKQYENLTVEVTEALEYAGKEKEEKEKGEKTTSEGSLEEVVKSAPVSKMVNVILRHAVEGSASDIHIEPHENESRVRYRIDGVLHTTLRLPKYIHPSVVSRIKVLANLKLDETRKPQDGRIHMKVADREVDFRISTMPLTDTEKVVMRILDVTKGAPTLEDLGFIGRNIAAIKGHIRKPNGLFLVTGPTGSGKSTTLFAALSMLNDEGVNIVTLEDPVEYYLPGANQSQVHPEVNYTFASGLRSILRQDPDIIMVGEIRDNETVELAIQAALTGHIVLSTLHTNDALGAVPRLLDMKAESFLLATTINVLVAQRLVRRICDDCKEKTELTADLIKRVEKIISEIPGDAWYEGIDPKARMFYKGKGCPKCSDSGYRGRLAISEVVENTRNMQKIIAAGFNADAAREELLAQKFVSMMQDGIMKALLGLTTIDEVVVATKE